MRARLRRPARGGEGDAGEGRLRRARASRRSRRATCSAPRRRRGSFPRSSSRRWPRGALVPDDVVIGLIDERTRRRRTASPASCSTASPGPSPQADGARRHARASAARSSTPSLALEVPRELLIERAVLRRTDKRTGQIYHLKYSPPPPGCRPRAPGGRPRRRRPQAPRYVRGDDGRAPPVLRELGILRRVDGVGSVDEVTERVSARALGSQVKEERGDFSFHE